MVQAFLPWSWPWLKYISAAWLLVPLQQLVPSHAKSITDRACRSVLIAEAAGRLTAFVSPDIARTYRMWRQFLPMWLRYRWTYWRYQECHGYTLQEIDRAWAKRHEWGAVRVYSMMLDLSGYYVKAAQIIASKGDFIPKEWIPHLSLMFDAMPPRPWPYIAKELTASLQDTAVGRYNLAHGHRTSIHDVFESMEQQCLASASIAQVHGGILSKGLVENLGWRWKANRHVVVKVQHPDMCRLMGSDVRNLGRLSSFVKAWLPFDPIPILEEMSETVPKEFHFGREARLMRIIGARLHRSGFHTILVAQPLLALCSPNLLVMERMSGQPFSRVLQVVDKDPQLKARACRALRLLMRAYGCMILQHGLFHADPHPGNFLLQDDGKLVLLDFGQCKALTAKRQRALAKLMIALDQGWPDQVVAAMSGMGLDFSNGAGGRANPLLVTIVANIIFDTKQLPEGCVNPVAEDAIIKTIPLDNFPRDLFMVARALMLLRGLCHRLGLDIQAAKLWRPYAEAVLRDKNLEARALENKLLDNGEEFDFDLA
eukprot:jgi/Botrbrau1/15692/Bobra.4_1s0069.1